MVKQKLGAGESDRPMDLALVGSGGEAGAQVC